MLEYWSGTTRQHVDILYLHISETPEHESIISNKVSKEERNGHMS